MATSLQSQEWSQRCMQAAVAASECADWCMQNEMPADHIRLCLDVANIGTSTARIMAREEPYMQSVLEACTQVLEACARSCEKHEGMHEAMDRCMRACKEAAQAVRQVAGAQSSQSEGATSRGQGSGPQRGQGQGSGTQRQQGQGSGTQRGNQGEAGATR